MSPINTANDGPEKDEQVNTNKKKKINESMTTRAIRTFVEKKLTLGGKVFDEMMKSKCTGLETDFAAFITGNRDFSDQSKEQQEAFRAVTSAQFLRETISIGVGFTSKRKAFKDIVNRGYSFTASELKKVESTYETLTTDELTNLLQSESKREKFLKNLFPKKTLPYRSEKEQMVAIFGKGILGTRQEEYVMNLLVKRYVDPQHVQEALAAFDDTQKQLLLKTFLPTVTLGQLGDMGVLTKVQIKSAVHESITRGHMIPELDSFNSLEQANIVDQIDPYDIVIETQLFPQDVVDIILESDGSKMIAKEITKINSARYDAVETENALKMKPTTEGLFFPSFLEELNKLGIKNIQDFKVGSIIRGTIPGTAGKDIDFAYRIDDISDEPQFNKNTGGNGRVFAVSDILLADGSLHLNKEKSKSAEYTYTEMYHIFSKAKKDNLEILTPEKTKHQIETGSLKEHIIEEEIQSLDDLNRALNAVDSAESMYIFGAKGGASIQVGKPGEKDYGIFQVKSINEAKGTLELVNNGESEIFDYLSFYSAFASKKAKRIPAMNSIEDFLKTMQSHSRKPSNYSKLSLEGDKIVSEESRGNKEVPGITEFAGSKGFIKILDTKTPGRVEFLFYEEFEESKGLNDQKERPVKYSGGYHLLYQFLNTEAFEPKIPTVKTQALDETKAHIAHKKGYLKHYMGNPSLHDILHGGKNLIGAIKKKLEHGSHLHSAHVQLGLAKGLNKLGLMDNDILREMCAGVYAGNKKLMQEMIDEMKNMSGSERQAKVRDVLGNDGSHDYEIQAATIAMLQKHGSLYVGDVKTLQGSFIYFERISGLKYSKNLSVVQKYMKRCDEMGEPFTEEGLIVFHIKAAGGQGEVDGNLWLEIAKAWGMGRKEQDEAGKEEGGKFQFTKGRIKESMDKLDGGESAKGIGGFEPIWAKGGPAHEMHLPAIVLALSNIPSTLHQDQLNGLKGKFFGGHPYTALLFLGSKGNQNTFRAVMKKLANSNGMDTDYAKIEKLQKDDPKKELIKAIMTFWAKHGETLNKKLNVTEDGELLHLAKTDADCAVYLNTCKGSIGNINQLNNDERDNEAYEHGGSSFLGLNPEHYFKFIKMNPAQVTFESDDNTQRFWPSFQQSLGAIRTMNSGGTEEDTKAMQKELYMKYHKTLMSYFNSGRIEKSVYTDKLKNQDYMKELRKNYGIELTPYGKSYLESREYVQAVEADFEAFLVGGRPDSIVNEIKNVGGTVGNLLEQTGYHGSAVNDDFMKRGL